MHPHLRRAAAVLSILLLAGCSSLHARRAGTWDDLGDPRSGAAAFLGYHGPLEHWDLVDD